MLKTTLRFTMASLNCAFGTLNVAIKVPPPPIVAHSKAVIVCEHKEAVQSKIKLWLTHVRNSRGSHP